MRMEVLAEKGATSLKAHMLKYTVHNKYNNLSNKLHYEQHKSIKGRKMK